MTVVYRAAGLQLVFSIAPHLVSDAMPNMERASFIVIYNTMRGSRSSINVLNDGLEIAPKKRCRNILNIMHDSLFFEYDLSCSYFFRLEEWGIMLYIPHAFHFFL